MAGFILTRNSNNLVIERSKKTFQKRGFNKYKVFATSCGDLLLYSKQMIEVMNYYVLPDAAIYCVGTIVYKGMSYTDSLVNLLTDFRNNQIKEDDILGEYVVLFDCNGKVSIMTDATGMYKLFCDTEYTFISSSFMAASSNTACTINDIAVAEQLLCGFVSAPDTLVNEIINITSEDDKKKIEWVNWIKSNARHMSINSTKGAQSQAKLLREYMNNVSSISKEFGAECGLSGGCDSRLVYVSANEEACRLNSVHSHKTAKIHDKELDVVTKLAQIYQTPLIVVPTEYLLDCAPDVIDSVVKENTLYFDCRNAEAIGAFSQTHTRSYKEKVANGNGVTFSGIGGEIYRDFYYSRLPYVSIKRWLESRIFLPRVNELLDKKTYKSVVDHIEWKIKSHINTSSSRSDFGKRYFDTYRIPQALSNVVHANNQMSFYLAPFTEQDFILSAKNDVKWQDHCGEYEGKIISEFNKNACELVTSKGYDLLKISHLTKVKWVLRAYYPTFIWKIRRNYVSKNERNCSKFMKALGNSKYLLMIYDEFKERYHNWDFSKVENGYISISNLIFTASSLYEIKHIKDYEV